MSEARTGVCPIRVSLEQEVQNRLQTLAELVDAEVEVITSGDEADILSRDKGIETALGEKERALGSLRQHRKDHGC